MLSAATAIGRGFASNPMQSMCQRRHAGPFPIETAT
jgi:hypothetical protein